MTEEDIQKLILESKEGNDDSFGVIYDFYAEPIYKFIYVRVRHTEVAEDLLSLTFLKAWKNLSNYSNRAGAKFSTWLFQISMNIIKDYWKKKKAVPIEDYMLKEFVTDETKNLETKMITETIMNTIAKLPEHYRNVLILRFVNELSVSETAEIMKKREGAIRTLQTRALKILRKHLK